MTLSGILMDEVALMPRSFVEQASADALFPVLKCGSTAIRIIRIIGFTGNG